MCWYWFLLLFSLSRLFSCLAYLFMTGPGSSFGERDGREVTGSIPGRDVLKALKWHELLLAWHSDLQDRAKTGRPSAKIM